MSDPNRESLETHPDNRKPDPGKDLEEQQRTREDRRIEQEIRSHRSFSLAEAIGREGAFFLKGESPVGAIQQLQLALEHLIKTHLRDSQEALAICLTRRARAETPLLASRASAPQAGPAASGPSAAPGPSAPAIQGPTPFQVPPPVQPLLPEEVLRALVDPLLRNETLLRDFVREVDAEWGRLFVERPYFDAPNRPPDNDDPYPLEGVREALQRFIGSLASTP